MASIACVYKITCGGVFYIGSTSSLARRNRDHLWRLKRGIHPNPMLQKAYDDGGEFKSFHVEIIKPCDDVNELREKLRAAEQVKLDYQFNLEGCCNYSPNASGPNNGEMMKNKWEDLEYREKMVAFMKSRKGAVVTAETRKKMAAAKRGAKNAKSRAVECIHVRRGEEARIERFESAAAFGRAYGFSQQLVQSWLSGKCKPSKISRSDEDDKWKERLTFHDNCAARYEGEAHCAFFDRGGIRLRLLDAGLIQPPPPGQ